jgi:hypothetical protein
LEWIPSLLNAGGILAVTNATPPVITNISLSAGNLVLSGSNGPPYQTYYVLATTNLALPITNWSIIATNTFPLDGDFMITNAIETNAPQEFFQLEVQ